MIVKLREGWFPALDLGQVVATVTLLPILHSSEVIISVQTLSLAFFNCHGSHRCFVRKKSFGYIHKAFAIHLNRSYEKLILVVLFYDRIPASGLMTEDVE